jgi:Tfp pilus assembly protein PilE
MITSHSAKTRAGLTLLELVVVLGILVILASMIVPNVGGLIFQSRHAGNAAMVLDVNHAVNSFVARFAEHPDHWDSLLNSSDQRFTKLHTQILQTTNTALPVLEPYPLAANQAASLQNAGINRLLDADESRSVQASDNSSVERLIATGTEVMRIVKPPVTTPNGSTFLDIAFGLNATKADKWANEFVVFGLGTQTEMRGNTMTDVPIVQSATPINFYARVLCVYMIPPANGASTRAKYIGCFMPDGSTLPGNLQDYSSVAAFDK